MFSRLKFDFVILFLAALALSGVEGCNSAPPSLTVSAASNLQPAFTELGALFEKQSGTRVSFNFGATGSLAQQIAQGAPVDLFAAADRATVDDLAQRGFISSDSVQVYARGRIVIYVRTDSSLQIQSVGDLSNPAIQRIAIANPSRAPYGVAAREALQSVGVWNALESKIILTENIQQSLQYADTGSVDVAVTALSLAIGSKGKWTLIPSNLHKPIEQALGVVKGSPNERAARAFAAFVMSAEAQAVLKRYGYE